MVVVIIILTIITLLTMPQINHSYTFDLPRQCLILMITIERYAVKYNIQVCHVYPKIQSMNRHCIDCVYANVLNICQNIKSYRSKSN